MGKRKTVEVVITAKDKASKAFKDFDGAVGKLQKGLSAFAIVGAAKAAFELGKLGAQSLRTKAAFEAISGGAQNASRNLKAMTDATRGALSQQEAMAAANQLMQMGLANNAAELANVAEMATRLGTAMGRDAGESIESFALLLANQSIPRLDTFGISAGKVRTRILELMEATDGLTRETAFMQAVQEEGGKAMDRLGDEAEDAALSFDVLAAAVKDAKAAIGEELAPEIAELASLITPVIRDTAKWASAMNIARKQQTGLYGAVLRGLPILGFLQLRKTTLWAVQQREIEQLGKLGVASVAQIDQYSSSVFGLGLLEKATDEVSASGRRYGTTLAEQLIVMEAVADRAGFVAREQRLVAEAMAATSTQVALLSAGLGGAVSQQNRSYEQSQESIREKIEELNLELEKYQNRNGILVTSQDKLTLAQAASEITAGRLAEAQSALTENTDPETQLQLEAALVRAGQAQERSNQAINEAQPFITNYGKKINEVTGEIEEWQGKLTELEAQHKLAMNSIVFDLVMARLAIDGWTDAEINLALVTAESMGLIDQATLETAEAINAALLEAAQGAGAAEIQATLDSIARKAAGIPRVIDIRFNVTGGLGAGSILGPFAGAGQLSQQEQALADAAGLQHGGVGQGLTRVGEGGTELVNLPPRSRVFSNEASRMINSNNRSANLTINTSAPHEPIIDDFRMMEAFMGA